MENREKDRMSERTKSTETGEMNRKVSGDKGREQNSGAEFGQNIGRSEDLSERNQGGMMENRNKTDEVVKNKHSNLENESSRRSGSGDFGSSSGRSGSMGSESDISRSGSDISRDEWRDESSGRSGSSKPSSSSSEGRH